jgi:hypothetical protein
LSYSVRFEIAQGQKATNKTYQERTRHGKALARFDN